jgi:hypothetical protein
MQQLEYIFKNDFFESVRHFLLLWTNWKNVPALVLRSVVEFCYSYGWEDLNCSVESLVDFYLCGSLSNSGFLPIWIFSLEIWNLNKFVNLSWTVRIRSGKNKFLKLFMKISTFWECDQILWSVSIQSFSFSQVLDVFPLDPIGEVLQRNFCSKWSFEWYYFPEYECSLSFRDILTIKLI